MLMPWIIVLVIIPMFLLFLRGNDGRRITQLSVSDFENKLRKDIRLVVPRDGQWEEGELDEGIQKVLPAKR